MKRKIILLAIAFLLVKQIYAQVEEAPIKFFGYFQTTLTYVDPDNAPPTTSFSVQQMNLFLQKDLAANWTALVNLQFVNSYSSEKLWGSFNIEEVWVRYRANQKFTIKAGLQTPIFNNLNEINNRTPLLPYIIRPLAYERSFSEFINVDEYVPSRTFLQLYGVIPSGDFKFDYALHVGNSPNISSKSLFANSHDSQSGIDTTSTFSLGGRIGARWSEFKAGFSFTHDNTNLFKGTDTLIGLQKGLFDEMPRYRYGFDFSFHWNNLYVEAEMIDVIYDDHSETFDKDKQFYYATIGYNIFENLFVFGSWWYVREDYFLHNANLYEQDIKMRIYNGGLAYDFTDRIRMKLHIANVDIDVLQDGSYSNESIYIGTAISVFF